MPPTTDPSQDCEQAIDDAPSLRRRLMDDHGLWVDPCTAEFLVTAARRGQSPVRFIAACVRTGRSAFHTLSSADLRGPALGATTRC